MNEHTHHLVHYEVVTGSMDSVLISSWSQCCPFSLPLSDGPIPTVACQLVAPAKWVRDDNINLFESTNISFILEEESMMITSPKVNISLFTLPWMWTHVQIIQLDCSQLFCNSRLILTLINTLTTGFTACWRARFPTMTMKEGGREGRGKSKNSLYQVFPV